MLNVNFVGVNKFCPTRPERAEAPSPGQRPGLLRTQTCRPVRAKALKLVIAFLPKDVAKVRQFSDTTKFHPAELC